MFSTVFSSLFSILRNSQLESNVLPFVVNVTLDLYTNAGAHAAKRDEQTKNNGLKGREMFEGLELVVPSDKKAGFIFGFYQ